MSTTSTVSIDATTERPRTLRARLSALPWLTVVPLAVVMAYADGFWIFRCGVPTAPFHGWSCADH